jgi:hypothetical protein
VQKSVAILAVAGLIQLALGLGLIGFTVMGQQKQNAVFYGQAGIISAEFSPVSSTISSGQYVPFEVTVDTQTLGECSALFYWYRDGVLNQTTQRSGRSGDLYDGYIFGGSDVGTHTVEAVINVFPLDYSSYGDSVWCTGTVEVTSPYPSSSPYPTPTPTSSPNPTPTPNYPTPTPTTSPTPPNLIEETLMIVLGLLLVASGATMLWLSRRF